jgi:hypothetical protein
MQSVLLFVGAAIISVWGIGHLIPTRSIVSGFGEISPDNSRIITMEWLAEGLTLCFLGVVVALVAGLVGPDHPGTHVVARACAVMLFALAVVSAFTGARTSVLPMKLCPVVKSSVGIIYITATII